MKSFEHDYLPDAPISHQFLSSVRMLGEYRGRQTLNSEQSPEVLDTLKRAAIIQRLTAAYKEFEVRVGTITSAKGAKREMVMNAIKRMTGRFTIADCDAAMRADSLVPMRATPGS
jgi:hypothetical protein